VLGFDPVTGMRAAVMRITGEEGRRRAKMRHSALGPTTPDLSAIVAGDPCTFGSARMLQVLM
jgi:hypothetical protein